MGEEEGGSVGGGEEGGRGGGEEEGGSVGGRGGGWECRWERRRVGEEVERRRVGV